VRKTCSRQPRGELHMVSLVTYAGCPGFRARGPFLPAAPGELVHVDEVKRSRA
jgi:hypothetical protein